MPRRTGPVVAVLLALSLLLTGCRSSGKTSSAAPDSGDSQSSSAPLADTGPGSIGASKLDSGAQCPSRNTKAFAKTRFVLHTGEAFGAFHRYLYKPYKAGAFAKGSPGRVEGFAKAGLAALFIKRQARLASEDVKADPSLCAFIVARLAVIEDGVSGAVVKLKGGDPSDLTNINTAVSLMKSSLSGKGVAVREDPNPNLSATG